MRRVCFVLALAGGLIAGSFGIAAAQSNEGRIVVQVRTAEAAAGGARAVLRGPASVEVHVTGLGGRTVFKSLRPGRYTISVSAQCCGSAIAQVVLADAGDMHVLISLPPKTIARTRARAQVSVWERRLARNDPIAELSKNLFQALNRIGGANVLTSADGTLRGVSLEGKDPALTRYAFDGNRLPAPEALAAIDPQLLTSAEVDQADDAVTFYTFQPTLAPSYNAHYLMGGFGNAIERLRASSTFGDLGVAAQVDRQFSASPLNGSRYLDASGLTYLHDGGERGQSALVKLNGPIADEFSASAEVLLRSSKTAPIQAYFAGPVPAGSGPDNWENLASSYAQMQVAGAVGSWQTSVTASNIVIDQSADDRNAVLGGLHVPYTVETFTHISTANISMYRAVDAIHTMNVGIGYSRLPSLTAASGVAANGGPATFIQRPEDSATLDTSYDTHRGDLRNTVDLQLGGFDGELEPYISFEYRNAPSNRTRFFGKLGMGYRSVPAALPQPYDSPEEAQYDCFDNRIMANAPSAKPDPVYEAALRAGVDGRLKRGTFSFQVYDDEDAGLTLSQADVPFASASGMPSGYAAALLNGFTTFGGCAPAQHVAMFLIQDVTGLSVSYRGAELTATKQFTPRLQAQLDVSAHTATLRSSPRALNDPLSPYVQGGELPAVSPFDASLTLAWSAASNAELAANVHLVSANNTYNLPAYALVTVGAMAGFGKGRLAIVASNVGHAYSFLFASPRYALPMPTRGGTPLLLPAAPLAQPTIYAVYTVNAGADP